MSTGPTPAYLAEITTEAATGEIARIYEDIRRLTGGPLVALIYRHLATLPGALEAVWQAVSPLLGSGELQEGAWQIARGAWDGPVPVSGAGVQALAAQDRRRACDVIDAYNRANPVNYAVVCVLRASRRTASGGRRAREAASAWTPPRRIPSIAPIPAMDALDGRTRPWVDLFAKAAAPGEPVLVPTLYRHIAHWPAVLELAAREVAPRLHRGSFDPAIRRFEADLAGFAAATVRQHGTVIDASLMTPALDEVLVRFAAVIPELVVVGHFLRAVLEPD